MPSCDAHRSSPQQQLLPLVCHKLQQCPNCVTQRPVLPMVCRRYDFLQRLISLPTYTCIIAFNTGWDYDTVSTCHIAAPAAHCLAGAPAVSPVSASSIYLFIVTSAQLRSRCDVWLALRASLQTVQHVLHAASYTVMCAHHGRLLCIVPVMQRVLLVTKAAWLPARLAACLRACLRECHSNHALSPACLLARLPPGDQGSPAMPPPTLTCLPCLSFSSWATPATSPK